MSLRSESTLIDEDEDVSLPHNLEHLVLQVLHLLLPLLPLRPDLAVELAKFATSDPQSLEHPAQVASRHGNPQPIPNLLGPLDQRQRRILDQLLRREIGNYLKVATDLSD